MRFVLSILILALHGTAALAAELAGKARVLDGDTIEVSGQVIRLEGIDAPERGQVCERGGRAWDCGSAATDALKWMIRGNVRCTGSEFDRYDRLIATCTSGGVTLNAEMVRQGFALAFRRYSTRYTGEEKAAETARAGLWAGTFVAPWDFRAGRWASAASKSPVPGCPIKGNISPNGRIYHTPYSRHYDRTQIDTSRGERWFCSEAEALAAGWRAPRG